MAQLTLDSAATAATSAGSGRRVLVAGIGNIFHADDGFGPAVAERLARLPLPDGVRVWDVGIRGVHLAYELLDGGYGRVIFVDAVARGAAPGTIHIIEPDVDRVRPGPAADAHSMGPDAVLTLLTRLGGSLPPLMMVGCEPGSLDEDMALTEPVAAAVAVAVKVVLQLVSPQGQD
jgi:hydrogenase maturation protease